MTRPAKNLRVQIRVGADWLDLHDENSSKVTLTNQPVERNTKESAWRELIDAGTRACDVVADGFITPGPAGSAVRVAAFNGTRVVMRLLDTNTEPAEEVCAGEYLVSNMGRGGSFNEGEGTEIYFVSMAMVGDEPPETTYDRYQFTATWDGDEWILGAPVVVEVPSDGGDTPWTGDDEAQTRTMYVPHGDPAPDPGLPDVPVSYDEYTFTATWDGDEWILGVPVVVQVPMAGADTPWSGDEAMQTRTMYVLHGDPAPDPGLPDAPTATADPVIFPDGGFLYIGVDPVEITDASPLAVIYFTTDGTDPIVGASPIYSVPLTFGDAEAVELRTIAKAPGLLASGIVSATFTITDAMCWGLSPEIQAPCLGIVSFSGGAIT